MTLGDYIREIIVEPPETVTGTPPGQPGRDWWPWIVAGLVVAGLYYMSQEEGDDDEEDRPFGEAG